MERRDDPGAEFMNGVSQDDGNAEEVSIRNHREQPAGVGVSFALVRGGVGTTPGLASQGNLSALDAGGKNFGAEADLGHARLLLLVGAGNEKARRGGPEESLLLFYRLGGNRTPSFGADQVFGMNELRKVLTPKA